MSFTHLHVHTVYSLLDGASKIADLIDAVKQLGQNSIAITDHGSMFGVIEFYKAARAAGIKPVIGCEFYVAPRKMSDKIAALDRTNYHLVLLCENMTGYKNLMRLSSEAWLEGFYNKPRVDKALLKKHHEGLIALSACLAGEIPRCLESGDYEGAKQAAQEYRDIFGKDNFFLEIQDHGIPEQKRILPEIKRLSEELDIPLAATNDCHYIKKEDAYLQKVLLCIQTDKTISEPNQMAFPTDEFYVKSEQEMRELFPLYPDAIDNTQKIADRCNVEIEFKKLKLPAFPLPEGTDHEAYFRAKCEEGLKRRYGDEPSKELLDRLEYEIDVITKMGFTDYFLIVADYVGYAKKNDIPVGAGRGSGAGSLAAYCIGITEIDPIRYDLLFERFLNPERVSMPDFDIDFCTERRQEVIDYVFRRYGEGHVAQINTFGTLAAKAVINDVGKVTEVPAAVIKKVSSLIPHDPNTTLKSALQNVRELKSLYDNDSQIHKLIDTSMALEGVPRHTSTHAAGVVITEEPLYEYVPVSKNKNVPVTQFKMNEVEELGLVKMDFLGLKNITILHDAEMMIRRREPDFDLLKLPENDPKAIALFARGETDGVFQFESAGMRSCLTRLKPENIEDIIAVLSLYRPGPMDSIPRYIRCRHHPEEVTYKHPLLEPILNVTYGCIVYQEQVMQIFRTLAGYSLGRADIVRRAMAKKKKAEMDKEKDIFLHGLTDENGNVIVDGCIRRGIDEATALDIYSEMESFASYAFNRAHAAAYATISYQTAYVKTHYPAEYMAALLTGALNDSSKISAYIDEASRQGIKVLPPHVNYSDAGFTISENNIRFGLQAIKGIGRGLIDSIIAERAYGEYRSFYNFLLRTYSTMLNKRSVEGLIFSGALDNLGSNRRSMFLAAPLFMDRIAAEMKVSSQGQLNLFDMDGMESDEPRPKDLDEFPQRELLDREYEMTGLYLTGHPMAQYDDMIKAMNADRICDILLNKDNRYDDGAKINMLCMIRNIKPKITKHGEHMAFASAGDKFGELELIVFPRAFEESGAMLTDKKIVRLIGSVKREDETEPKIICDKLLPVPSNVSDAGKDVKRPKKNTPPGLYLRIKNQDCSEYERALQIIDIFDGNTPLYVFFTDSRKLWYAPRKMYVDINNVMLRELRKRLGDENVSLVENE